MKLLLFDIDGTLLRTQDVGRAAIEWALHRVFGRPLSTEGVSFSGKTDRWIVADVYARHGMAGAVDAATTDAVLDAYTEALRDRLRPEHIRVLPGVQALLDGLAPRPDVQLGLLTGNLEATAYHKLALVGLDGYFPFGAFGSDHHDRNVLAGIAVERAASFTGRAFAGRDVVVIGDTEHDIHCSRHIDALAVGVCTGRYTREALHAHTPDHLLDDLSDTPGFVAMVL